MTIGNFIEPELTSDDFDLPDTAATSESEIGLFLLSTPVDRLLVAYGVALDHQETKRPPPLAARTALLTTERLLHADDHHASISTHRSRALLRWNNLCGRIDTLGDTDSLPRRSGDPRRSWVDFYDATLSSFPDLEPSEVLFVAALWTRKVEIERHLADS